MKGVGKVLTRGSSIMTCPAGRGNLLNSIKCCQRKAYLRQGFSLFLLNVITSLPCSVEIFSKILTTVSSNSALEKTAWGSRAFLYLLFDLGDFLPPAQRGSCPSVCSQLACIVPKTEQEFPGYPESLIMYLSTAKYKFIHSTDIY